MEYINQITLQGVVGSVKISEVGSTSIMRLSVATNEYYVSSQKNHVINTTWHNVTYFGGPDLPSIEKGAKVRIVGRMKQTRYTASDGVERSAFEVIANSIELISE